MSSFRKLAVFSTAATVLLVTIGGLVRSTGSGLGCSTSWPDCSGRIIPDFHNHKVVIEFTHRIVAGVVALLLAALVLKAWQLRKEHPPLLMPTLAAFALVLFQAGLGAAVVVLELHAKTVMLHLGTAMALLALLVYVVVLATATERPLTESADPATGKRAAMAAGAVFLLLLVGSYMSGIEGSGRAFGDWPLMGGRLIPDLAVEEKAIHFFHRALAAIVGAILFITLLPMMRNKAASPAVARLAHVAVGLFAVEVLVGALNVWTDLNAAAVTSHLLIGALIWSSLVGIAVLSSARLRAKAEAPRREPVHGALGQGA
jgi:heme A synthase